MEKTGEIPDFKGFSGFQKKMPAVFFKNHTNQHKTTYIFIKKFVMLFVHTLCGILSPAGRLRGKAAGSALFYGKFIDRAEQIFLPFSQHNRWKQETFHRIRQKLCFQTETASVSVNGSLFPSYSLHKIAAVKMDGRLICQHTPPDS